MNRSLTEGTKNLPSVMNAETIMCRIGNSKNFSNWHKIDDEKIKVIRNDHDYIILHVTDNAYSYTSYSSMQEILGQESGKLCTIADINSLMRRIVQWSLQSKFKRT